MKTMTRDAWFRLGLAVAGATVLVLTMGAVVAALIGHVAVMLAALALLAGLVACLQLASLLAWRRLWQEQAESYRQTEAVLSLSACLRLKHPLPPMRGWAISPDFANVLIQVLHERRPRCIVETGSGVSTLVMAAILRRQGSGRLISIEHDGNYAAATQRLLDRHDLLDHVEVVHAPLQPTEVGIQSWHWYDRKWLASVEAIDMLVIDGPPGGLQRLSRYPALPVLLERLSDTAVVVLDDAARPDERAIVARWLDEHEGFTREYLPTEKGTVILRRGTRPRPHRTGQGNISTIAMA